MLSTPTPFPQQGSKALLGRLPVRIIQPMPGGTALVSGHLVDGRTMTRTVAIADLSDAAMPDRPIDRWIEERLTSAPANGFTLASDLHRDFAAWCRDRGSDDRSIPGAPKLHAQLREHGFVGTIRTIGRPTGPMRVMTFNVTLHPIVEAA